MSQLATGAGFEERMVAWLNRRFGRDGVTIAADTPLFAGRLIDSIRILELIAWTERAIGREIPDADIRMDNFRSVARIAEVFAHSAGRGTREGGRTAPHYGLVRDRGAGVDDVAVEGGAE
jgi:acyl carrier protein